jgi:hypothetical protein
VRIAREDPAAVLPEPDRILIERHTVLSLMVARL